MKYLISVFITILSLGAMAEDFYDERSRSYIDVESEERWDEDVSFEYYDYASQRYQSGTIREVDDNTIRVEDDASGDIRTFELSK